jgi:hypothetical protein
MPTGRRLVHAALATLLAATLAACAGDPALDVERRRAAYDATVTGFLVREEPDAARPKILLDVTVRGDARPPLPGITVDVTMVDGARSEKARRRVWIDTSALGPGGEQTTLVLEDLDFAPGDGFWVEVRTPVPPAERGEYREFAEAGR